MCGSFIIFSLEQLRYSSKHDLSREPLFLEGKKIMLDIDMAKNIDKNIKIKTKSA